MYCWAVKLPVITIEPVTIALEANLTVVPSSVIFELPMVDDDANLTIVFCVPETDTEVPDVPPEPAVPIVPELPLEPEEPLEPAVPFVPEVPPLPAVPLVPDVPPEPAVPLVPDVFALYDVPFNINEPERFKLPVAMTLPLTNNEPVTRGLCISIYFFYSIL